MKTRIGTGGNESRRMIMQHYIIVLRQVISWTLEWVAPIPLRIIMRMATHVACLRAVRDGGIQKQILFGSVRF